jgi:hypothetical protein
VEVLSQTKSGFSHTAVARNQQTTRHAAMNVPLDSHHRFAFTREGGSLPG